MELLYRGILNIIRTKPPPRFYRSRGQLRQSELHQYVDPSVPVQSEDAENRGQSIYSANIELYILYI